MLSIELDILCRESPLMQSLEKAFRDATTLLEKVMIEN